MTQLYLKERFKARNQTSVFLFQKDQANVEFVFIEEISQYKIWSLNLKTTTFIWPNLFKTKATLKDTKRHNKTYWIVRHQLLRRLFILGNTIFNVVSAVWKNLLRTNPNTLTRDNKVNLWKRTRQIFEESTLLFVQINTCIQEKYNLYKTRAK